MRSVSGSRTILAAALTAVAIAACGLPEGGTDPGVTTRRGAFPGIEDEANLATLATPCAYDAGAVTINLMNGEYALIAKDSSDRFLVNGTQCQNAKTSADAGAALVTKVTINGSADAGNETVVLDFLAGAFVPGTATVPGFTIDLKTGSGDAIKIRGTNYDDSVIFTTVAADAGAKGAFAASFGWGVSGDAGVASGTKNLAFTNVETFVLSTGPGNDKFFNGKADAGLANPFGQGANAEGPFAYLYGGEDDDTFTMGTAKAGKMYVYGGANADAGVEVDTVDFSLRTNAVTVTIGAATCGEASEAMTIDTSVEKVIGGKGADTLTCEAATACTLDGSAGDDLLKGGSGDDTFIGGAGIDTLTFAGKADGVTFSLAVGTAQDLDGSGSNTEADTASGIENLVGSDEIDTLTGDANNNRIEGGGEADVLNGGGGDDVFYMGTSSATCGDDAIDGAAGSDTVDFSGRANTETITFDLAVGGGDTVPSTDEAITVSNVENLIGGAGADVLDGDDNPNVIEGGAGNDTIDAKGGADTIDPGTGTNTVTCGEGSDVVLGPYTPGDSSCEG